MLNQPATPELFLGTHMVNWLRETDVPLFVSRRRLERMKRLPRAKGKWGLDSGGFTELALQGKWSLNAHQYAARVHQYRLEIGNLEFAAPMDWMCEPFVVQKTGLSVREHQERTVENYLTLRLLAPHLPFIPVLQGWDLGDYLRCVELYDRHHVDLRKQRLVGIGTVCRRQGTKEASEIIRRITALGIPLHLFGYKISGLSAVGDLALSADTMAWSYNARKNPPLEGCTHKSCANCLKWALAWRKKALKSLSAAIRRTRQWELALAG